MQEFRVESLNSSWTAVAWHLIPGRSLSRGRGRRNHALQRSSPPMPGHPGGIPRQSGHRGGATLTSDGHLQRLTSAIGEGSRHREACRHQLGVAQWHVRHVS